MTAFQFRDGFLLKSFENGFNEIIHKTGIVFVQAIKNSIESQTVFWYLKVKDDLDFEFVHWATPPFFRITFLEGCSPSLFGLSIISSRHFWTYSIIATHNANIPVLGDSELIIVLEAEKEKCKIAEKGSIDKEVIRQNVKSIMEGGEEAFRKRAEKYGSIF